MEDKKKRQRHRRGHARTKAGKGTWMGGEKRKGEERRK